MAHSILTTHVGSLPRPQEVVDVVFAQDDGKPVDDVEFARVVGGAVADRVARQIEAGVDLVSDGEMSKIGYATYVRHRLSGFELDDVPRATPADLDAARTPVEQTKGPIFMVGGGDDQLWPSCVLAKVAWDALVANGHDKTYADEMHCYPDAGHFISFPPGSSTLDSDGYFAPDFNAWLLVGGTPEGIAAAQRQGNTAMRGFLDQAFGKI